MTLHIAIDGPAGSGKSTVARMVADRLGLTYIDTGAMYRALGLKALRHRASDEAVVVHLLEDTTIVAEGSSVIMDGEDVSGQIRTPEVAEAASAVAQIGPVRAWMVAHQRKAAKSHPAGSVMEGRDIGTVVLQDADVKIFLDAHPSARALRRARDLGDESASAVADTLQAVTERDTRDMTRDINPLVAAEDARVLDTTSMTIEEVVDLIVTWAQGSDD